jgi:hypothetical protein
MHLCAPKQDAMAFFNKLKKRWKVESSVRVVLILVVFALTGTTILYIKEDILRVVYGGEENAPFYVDLLYYTLILPLYLALLLLYGFIFGQYRYFIGFVGRFTGRMKKWFKMKKNGNK